jgi:putative peptidoglycan lipid II flippase
MSDGAKSARAAGKVSFAILISRILGLVRDQFFAKLFGAGLYNDAWLVALRLPNLLRDLFAEGALSAAFVPTFTSYLKNEGRQEAWQLANLVLSALMVLLGLFTLVLFFFSDFFVQVLAAGFSDVPGKVEITATLIKILSPFLLLVAMASVAMGMLNTLNHFFLPALAPAVFNVSLIAAAIFLVPRFEEGGVLPIYAMGVGAVVGGLLQFGVQIPLLRREGFRFRPTINFRHPGLLRLARLIGPAIVGVSAVQINVLVNTQIASFLQDNGPVSWLSYAFRIMYLPIGLFGVAVGVVNLKEVSLLAATESMHELKETVANSLKLVGFLAIPSTVGLLLLAGPIVEVLFERGGFTPADTRFTSYALMAYGVGLFAYSSIKVYVPTFYALGDTRTPVRNTLVAVATNLAANITLILVLPEGYRYIGLALGTSLSVALNSSLLAVHFRRRLGSMEEFGIAASLWKTTFAAVLMGGAVLLLNRYARVSWDDMKLLADIVSLLVSISGGCLVFFVVSWLLKIEELRHLNPFARR